MLILLSVLLVATYAQLSLSICLLGVLGTIIVAVTQRPNLFAVFLIPLVAFILNWTDLSIVTRRFLTISLVIYTVIILLYYTIGFGNDSDYISWRSYSEEFVYRKALGFSHPNRAMMYWEAIAVPLLMFSSIKWRIKLLPLVIAISVFLYTETDSRTSFVLIMICVVFVVIGNKRIEQPVSKTVRGWVCVTPAVFALFAFALPAFADNAKVNAMLSGRPTIYLNLLNDYSILAPFGTKAVENGIVDNGFIQLFLAKGATLAILYITLLMRLLTMAPKMSFRTVAILGLFLVLALFETTLLSIVHLFSVILACEFDRRAFSGTNPEVHSNSSKTPLKRLN